ncbi:Terminase small subunit [Caloramator mitchellensis]|uniref:Terminase small subunit n=1 Tax=Caloramator mitchellensis TaxID=908809 RepID=A0A0R3JRC7_CALMK|nr:terminase small subunit [Caloramator mitchellensis]KRQ86043.1 Terminase small subunit [Caloramator mitchellensis]
MGKLTKKQKAFCDFYIETLNATESYKRAYNTKNDDTARKNGSRLLTNVDIKNYISERLKQIENQRIAKAEEVLEFLSKSMRGEIKEEVVVVESVRKGATKAKIIKKQIGARDRIKAAELLGKRYTLFTEKVNVEGNMGVVIIDDIKEDGANED